MSNLFYSHRLFHNIWKTRFPFNASEDVMMRIKFSSLFILQNVLDEITWLNLLQIGECIVYTEQSLSGLQKELASLNWASFLDAYSLRFVSVGLSVRPSTHFSICLFVRPFGRRTIRPPICWCLFIRRFVRPSVCLSVLNHSIFDSINEGCPSCQFARTIEDKGNCTAWSF